MRTPQEIIEELKLKNSLCRRCGKPSEKKINGMRKAYCSDECRKKNKNVDRKNGTQRKMNFVDDMNIKL